MPFTGGVFLDDDRVKSYTAHWRRMIWRGCNFILTYNGTFSFSFLSLTISPSYPTVSTYIILNGHLVYAAAAYNRVRTLESSIRLVIYTEECFNDFPLRCRYRGDRMDVQSFWKIHYTPLLVAYKYDLFTLCFTEFRIHYFVYIYI